MPPFAQNVFESQPHDHPRISSVTNVQASLVRHAPGLYSFRYRCQVSPWRAYVVCASACTIQRGFHSLVRSASGNPRSPL